MVSYLSEARSAWGRPSWDTVLSLKLVLSNRKRSNTNISDMLPWLRLLEELAQRKIVMTVINDKPSFERHTKNLPCLISNQMSQINWNTENFPMKYCTNEAEVLSILLCLWSNLPILLLLQRLKFLVTKELERVPPVDATSVSGALALCPNI
jgi:hypothetical protein